MLPPISFFVHTSNTVMFDVAGVHWEKCKLCRFLRGVAMILQNGDEETILQLCAPVLEKSTRKDVAAWNLQQHGKQGICDFFETEMDKGGRNIEELGTAVISFAQKFLLSD